MILQPARIITASTDHYILETLPKSACPRCAEGKGCGGGILAQAFANKTYQLTIHYDAELSPAHHENELVQVGMNSNGLLIAALIMYLLPLVLLMSCAALFGALFGFDDQFTVTGAVIGLVVGVLISNRLSRKHIESGQSRPFIVEEPDKSCYYKAS